MSHNTYNKWMNGRQYSVPDPDLEIRGGGGRGGGLQKKFFGPGLKIRGTRAPRASPLDPPLIFGIFIYIELLIHLFCGPESFI